MKRILIVLLAVSFHVNATTDWSACTALMEEMASTDISDETGSISTAYSCETSEVIVTAKIKYNISTEAVIAASPSFIDNYCLNISKNYMLADPTTKQWMQVVFKGGVNYVIEHPLIEKIVYKKSFDECLEFVHDISEQLPETQYEQTKTIRKYSAKTQGY